MFFSLFVLNKQAGLELFTSRNAVIKQVTFCVSLLLIKNL